MDDLLSEFIAETMESITALDSALVSFEKEPENTEALGNIFRLVHTIKGTCGFLGLSRLEALTHASENVLGKLRAKSIPVSAELISTVLESLDATKSIVEYIGAHGTEPAGDDAELIRELDTVADLRNSGSQKDPERDYKTQSQAVVEDIFPTQPEEAPDDAALANNRVQSIRVNLNLLENLMEMVGELVLTRNQVMQVSRMQDPRRLSNCLQQLNHITSELQEGVMKTRMQPIGNAWSKFPRLIRELSHDLGKKIALRMIGADTELDRQLLEAIKDPLTHMIRNSADHGLEPPEERLDAGKPETGTVSLSAFHEGGHIIIEMSDDGRGLNIEKIKQRALKNGLATEEDISKLTSQQIVQFIFLPGFSTADKVTNISGRGVGMDVVRYNIEKIGGTLELTSFQGKGSKFSIKIPLTLAIASMLIVKVGDTRFALPQLNIQEVVRIGSNTEHVIEHINTSPVMRLRGRLVPVLPLADVLGLAPGGEGKGNFVVVCKVGGYSFGLQVGHILDMEEIVIKPISEVLKSIPIYSGNAILGDGSIIMTLDPHGLARASGAEDVSSTFDTASMMGKTAANDDLVSLLLFRSQSDTVRAVPLELVTRIEKMDMAAVEQSGTRPVIQYKNGLMRLHTMAGEDLPQKDIREVIVFTYDNAYVGLVTDKALDIVNVPYDIKLTSNKKGLFGTMVINGKAMDVVDIGYMLREVIGISDVEGAFAATDKKYELLLVEDSAFFRSLTIPLLISVGYKVTAVKDASEALKTLEAKPQFDIIVSDIEMPGMDGFTFAECCHKNPRISHIPMFAYTSNKNEQIMQKSKLYGFQDLVPKNDRAALLKSIAVFFQETRWRQHAHNA